MFGELFRIDKFSLYSTYMWYLIIFCNNFPIVFTSDIQCKNQYDCNDGKNIILCGICVTDNQLDTGKCIFPFPYMFEDGKKCLQLNSCEDDCKSRGSCIIKHLMVPQCSCQKGFYGRKCEYSVGKGLTTTVFSSVGISFIGTQNQSKYTVGWVKSICYREQYNYVAYVDVETDEGFYAISTYNCLVCENSSPMGMGVSYKFKTIFPYKRFDREAKSKTLQFGNEILGYLSAYRIVVKSNQVVNYENYLPVFVSYRETNLICIPVIRLSGCAPRTKYEHVYTQSDHIKISSNVIFLADGRYVSTSKRKPECEKNAKYYWRLNSGYNCLSNPDIEYHGEKYWSFDPYTSLEFNDYTIQLEVTSMQERPSKNVAICYFRMKFTPLVAIIDGGSEREVSKNYGLILSTSRSNDPNTPRDKQDHMKASWSCVDISKSRNDEICNPLLALPVSNIYIVPSEKLSYGAVYNITLRVWTNRYSRCLRCKGEAFDSVLITIANKTDGEDYIYIQCVKNCEKKVIQNQQLYLRVKSGGQSKKSDHQLKWTYYEKGQTKEQDAESIMVKGLPPSMFIVKENMFSSGKSYVIVARVENKKWFAKYAFKTHEVEFNGSCSITPTSGTKLLTLFQIQCQNFSGSPTYEFYDKSAEEAQAGIIFNGRMLGTSEHQSNIGELTHFRVARGQVLVYIIDDSGLYTQQNFTVDILPLNVTEELMSQIFFNLTELFNQGESAKMLEYISCVPDIVPLTADKEEILNKLLNFITLVPIETLADIKLTTSTMTNVLITLNKPTQLTIDTELMKNTLYIVRYQTFTLGRIVREGTNLKGMSPNEIILVATYQLNCLHAALMCKDPKTFGITEFDYDLKTLDDLMYSSNFAEGAIYLIKDILTFLQTPGQQPTKIASAGNSYEIWIMENDEEYNLTYYLSQYKEIPVVVSNELIKEFGTVLRENNEELAVRVATFDDNIFWWLKSNIASNLVSVTLVKHSVRRKTLGRIKFVKHDVGMKINLTAGLNSTQVNGSVMPYKGSKSECTLEHDLIIGIHRLDPEPQSLISLTFIFPQTNGSLLVYVEKNYRPDCKIMKKAVTINENFTTYRPIISDQDPNFYYVGIMPLGNVSVTYTFQVNTTVCQFWTKGHWSSEGCMIYYIAEGLEAHCQCDHFSIFGAAFPVPPQEIDLFSDINLFLTVFENPLVVSFVSIILILYFICCIWAWRKDRRDKNLKNVIVLNDNFPGDSFPYLLVIYTSSRFNAGTTAHVGIQITGSSASSRTHIFSSKERKVLQRNYDDWFVIFCPERLGDLESIHLWHDNSGSSPDWFCDKVIVYDLEDNSEVVFVVEQWVALRLTYFPEASVQGAYASQVNSVKRIFLDNCVLGVREGHSLFCIILRHPRSEVSRLQRISVLMVFLVSSMLCSIMFYSPQIDDHEYSVGLRDFYISLQSLVISIIATVLVLFAFKKSYKYKPFRSRSTIRFRHSQFDKLESRNKNDKSMYSNFVRFVSRRFKEQPLVPAQLPNSEPVVIVRKTWRILAWVLCIGVILTCSFFIMLYGLKLGLNKSKIWLSSILFTLGEDFFVTTPLRIIFFSIILSIALQKMCEMDRHRVTTNEILQIKPKVNISEMEKLLIRRRHQMYAPLRTDLKNEMLQKKELWSNWWTLIDFTVALCFIFVVSMVVFELWSSHFNNNNRVKKIMTTTYDSGSFFDFEEMSQVSSFLEDSILRILYITFWYNKTPIKDKGIERQYWAEDFTHTLVGHQRYRQIRISPVECSLNLLNTTRKCLPHYSDSTEDKGDYGARWKPANWHDVKLPNSAWKYTDESKSRFSTSYRLCGKSSVIFHDGGYLVDLGPTQILFKKQAEVLSNDWQDQLTRVVFVEFTLYNINGNLFSQVTMIVEYLISGKMLMKAQVVSVESKMEISYWNALFVAFVVYYVIRSGYLINRLGLVEYLSTSSRNRSRLVIVFLGVLSIALAVIHFLSSTAYYEHFINKGYGDTYFDFDSFVFYFILLQAVMSFLLAVAIFRTILIYRGGRTLLNFFYTFTISLRWIFWLTIVICIFLIVQVPLMFLLNIFSFYSIEEMVINLMFTQYFKSQSSELKHLQVFLCVKCMIVNCLLLLYVLIFKHYFKIAQTHKMRRYDQFNLILFVFGELKKIKRTK